MHHPFKCQVKCQVPGNLDTCTHLPVEAERLSKSDTIPLDITCMVTLSFSRALNKMVAVDKLS